MTSNSNCAQNITSAKESCGIYKHRIDIVLKILCEKLNIKQIL